MEIMQDKSIEEVMDMIQALRFMLATVPELPDSPRNGILLMLQVMHDKLKLL